MSNIPDRIYIFPDANDRWFRTQNLGNTTTEYIRKDALLEWIAVHRLLHGGVTWNTLIDKLNEL